MIAVDSTVVVAGFASWHERHETARAVLDEGPRLVAHAALESYSVLTRLPPPHRAPAGLVVEFLRQRFPEPYLAPSDTTYRDLITELATSRIVGGACYDALIARTAAEHDVTLITCDGRAAGTYEAIGVTARLIG